MKHEKNCIFCQIVKGEIPSYKLYENKNFLAFLDIKPVADGHLLIIPKEHIVWMYESSDEIISDIFKLTKKMMITLKESLKCDYIIETVAGNEIPHFHIHLIPRYFDDNLAEFPRKEYQSGQEKELIQKITSKL